MGDRSSWFWLRLTGWGELLLIVAVGVGSVAALAGLRRTAAGDCFDLAFRVLDSDPGEDAAGNHQQAGDQDTEVEGGGGGVRRRGFDPLRLCRRQSPRRGNGEGLLLRFVDGVLSPRPQWGGTEVRVEGRAEAGRDHRP